MQHNLQRGSIVICLYDFKAQRERWGYNYPHDRDILTVRGFTFHPIHGQQLTFEELNIPVALNAANFLELQTPDEGDAILTKVKNILTN